MRFIKTAALLALSCASSQASAAPLALYPVQTGEETARYRQGVPVLNVLTPGGALQIQPLPLDHGHVVFGISVFNGSGGSENFGSENVRATVGGAPVALLSLDQLQRQAKRRATWSKFGVAMVSGLAAGVAANAHTTDTAHTSVHTPRGSYSVHTTYRDYTIGAQAAGSIMASGTQSIGAIQGQLDDVLDRLSGSVIRTTTVDPGSSFGGIVVLDTLPDGPLPRDIHISIAWGGREHAFVFRLTREGQNMPAAYTTPPSPPQPSLATLSPAPPVPQPAPAVYAPPPVPSTPAPSTPAPSPSAPPPPVLAAYTPPVVRQTVTAPQAQYWPQSVPVAVQTGPVAIAAYGQAVTTSRVPLTEAAREQAAYEEGAALARAQLALSGSPQP